MITEPEGTDEELHALVTDAISVGDVARRYARIYSRDPMTVLAAVEATLYVLDDRKPVVDEVVSGDVVEAIMDTIDCYPGPVAGGPTRAHIEQLIRDYAAGQRAEGVEEGRRLAGEPVPVPPPVDARFAEIDDLLWRFTDIWLDGTGQVTVRDRALVETRRLFAAGVAEGRRQATGRPAYQRGDDCPTCGASGDDHG